MNRSTTPRIVAAIASVAITFLLFKAVSSLAEPQQATASLPPTQINTVVAMVPVASPR